MRHQPLPFSPLLDFVWTRAQRVQGVDVAPGDPVDKTLFTAPRLQALFMTRKIRPAGFGGPAPAYLANGAGVAEKLAKEIAAEEGQGETDLAEINEGLDEIQSATLAAIEHVAAPSEPATAAKPVKAKATKPRAKAKPAAKRKAA